MIKQIAPVPAKTDTGDVITVLYALTEDGKLWALYPYPVGWTPVELLPNA